MNIDIRKKIFIYPRHSVTRVLRIKLNT